MIAPSYQKIGYAGEPFKANGKLYVTLNDGRRARWYSESEFRKAFPNAEVADGPAFVANLHQVLGFGERNFIYVLVGDTYDHKDEISQAGGRFHKSFGWYFIEGIEVPELPEDIKVVKIEWEQVSVNDGQLKTSAEIKAIIDSIAYAVTEGEFIGTVGDRIPFTLTVTSAHPMEGYFGTSTVYHFKDENGNYFLWNTASKNWEVGETHTVKGTVKAQEVNKGKRVNILTRCTEIK